MSRGALRPRVIAVSDDHVTHVGLYLGDGQMIDAPHSGAAVRVEPYRWDNYLRATRPAAGSPRSILTPYRAATRAR